MSAITLSVKLELRKTTNLQARAEVMSQVNAEQVRETGMGLHIFGDVVRGAGNAAIKPVVFGYEATGSALNILTHWEVLRNLGAVAEAALGLRDGVHSLKLEGKPARIDTFEHGDPWEFQAKSTALND